MYRHRRQGSFQYIHIAGYIVVVRITFTDAKEAKSLQAKLVTSLNPSRSVSENLSLLMSNYHENLMKSDFNCRINYLSIIKKNIPLLR